jgi:hypothetical protein
MDAYHKILVKIREVTGGKETVDVDMVELTRKEGYFPSLDEILGHLKTEGWVTESRPNTIRITHWGNAEAKKAGSVRPDAARTVERESKRLLNETREFAVVIEEFIADPSSKKFNAVKNKFTEMEALLGNIRDAL